MRSRLIPLAALKRSTISSIHLTLTAYSHLHIDKQEGYVVLDTRKVVIRLTFRELSGVRTIGETDGW
jgi:hypothetical protein